MNQAWQPDTSERNPAARFASQPAGVPSILLAGDTSILVNAAGRAAAVRTALNTTLIYGVVVAALIPVVFLLAYSFDVSGIAEPYRFGFGNWISLVTKPGNLAAIGNSLLLSTRVVIGGAVALLLSWCLVRLDLPGRRFIEIALWFGFFMPAISVAMAWELLLDPHFGLINQAIEAIPFVPQVHFSVQSIAGIMWVHLTITTIPFLTLIFAPTIRQFDATYEEAARASGASWFTVARRVTLPLLAPAIFAGLIANYIRSFDSFEVEQLLGTPAGIFVFATRVYNLVSQALPSFPQAMALSALLLFVAAGLAVLHNRFNRNRPPAPTLGPNGFRRGHTIGPAARWAITGAIVLFILISVALPVAVIVMGSFATLFGFFNIPAPWTLNHWSAVLGDPRFLRALTNSLVAGIGIGIVSVSLFFWLAWLLVRGSVKGKALAAQLFWLPWALPGFVLGLAMLWLMLRYDLLAPLYGTFIPLLVVLGIKELPIGVHLFKVAIEQLSPQLEEAAAVAGARQLYAIRRITLPLLSSAVVSVFIIVFIAVIKEISSIVLVAAPGTETISLLLYEYAFTGKAESAAVIGVLYSVAALVLAVLVSRRATAEYLR